MVDTNVLLYAANRGCAEHLRASAFIERLIAEATPWCLTWPIVYEFLRVATHRRAPRTTPLTASQAVDFIFRLVEAANISFLGPTDRHQSVLETVVKEY